MGKIKLIFGILPIILIGLIFGGITTVWAAPPAVANPIPNQTTTEEAAFNFQFAANTFNDPDEDMLTYSAQLNGGGALPAWLSFNSATRTFSGTPVSGDVGTLSIDVIADDGNGETITDTFDIVVNALEYTDPPLMDAPASNATYGTIPVDFALSEIPLTGSIRLTFFGSSTITIDITVANPAIGPYEFSINPTNILATGAPITSSSQNTIPNGNYSVILSYQNAAGDPAGTVTANNVTINSSLVDTDGDGSLDSVEDAGPNNGDANGDDIADSLQANVYSYLNPLTTEYGVMETDCERISNFQIGGESSEFEDTDYDYPMGLASFWIYCTNEGDTATIQHYYHGVQGSELYSVRKWMNDGSYREIPDSRPLGTLVGGQVVFLTEFKITDGGEFDDDGVEDGVIRDPSGAALRTLASIDLTPVPSDVSGASSHSSPSLARTGVEIRIVLISALGLIGSGSLAIGLLSSRKSSN